MGYLQLRYRLEPVCRFAGTGSVSVSMSGREIKLTSLRAHRIGQKKEVRVLRLISSGTVEELVLARAQRKLEIDGKVIQAGKFDDNTTGAEYEALLVSVTYRKYAMC